MVRNSMEVVSKSVTDALPSSYEEERPNGNAAAGVQTGERGNALQK
jgi:hypothetical protein